VAEEAAGAVVDELVKSEQAKAELAVEGCHRHRARV
jgi:hypothetical protein